MKAKFYPNPASLISLLLSIVFNSLILFGTSGSVYGQWKRHIIDPSLKEIKGIVVHDIDLDGDMDLFVAEAGTGKILLYENNNNLAWEKHVVDDCGRVYKLDLADFDNNDTVDLVAGLYAADEVAWYKNDGGYPINWIKNTIDNSNDAAVGVNAADFNGDSAIDILCKWYGSGEVIWYDNNLPTSWTSHLIGSNMPGTGHISVADLNNDEKPDIYRTIVNQDKVVWLEHSFTLITPKNFHQLSIPSIHK